ncbi:DUF4245 family protein [Actinokineospora sp. NPDC004072]
MPDHTTPRTPDEPTPPPADGADRAPAPAPGGDSGQASRSDATARDSRDAATAAAAGGAHTEGTDGRPAKAGTTAGSPSESGGTTASGERPGPTAEADTPAGTSPSQAGGAAASGEQPGPPAEAGTSAGTSPSEEGGVAPGGEQPGSPAAAGTPAGASPSEAGGAGAGGGRPGPTERRLAQSLRDMVWSLVALLLIIAALLVFNRGCSFSPGGPSIEPESVPTVDLTASLQSSARTVGFPVRLPAVPAQWRANSSSTSAVPPVSVVVRAGWLTPERFVQLSQSGAGVVDLVRVETERDDPGASGSVTVDGTQWTVYPGRRKEVAWVTDLGDVRLLITGTGTEAEFRALAQAAQQAAPLPKE